MYSNWYCTNCYRYRYSKQIITHINCILNTYPKENITIFQLGPIFQSFGCKGLIGISSIMFKYNLRLSLAKQALLEDVHWRGAIAPKDYIATCFHGLWLQPSCIILDQFEKLWSPFVPYPQSDPRMGSRLKSSPLMYSNVSIVSIQHFDTIFHRVQQITLFYFIHSINIFRRLF